jgi:hypothetical protein
MTRHLLAATSVLALLGCAGERAAPPARASADIHSPAALPSVTPAVPLDTAAIRVKGIEYRLLYNYGDTSADLVEFPESTMTAAIRSPADMSLVRVTVVGPAGASASDIVLSLRVGAQSVAQAPLSTFGATRQQSFSFRIRGAQRCDSVALSAVFERGPLQFGKQEAAVVFEGEGCRGE